MKRLILVLVAVLCVVGMWRLTQYVGPAHDISAAASDHALTATVAPMVPMIVEAEMKAGEQTTSQASNQSTPTSMPTADPTDAMHNPSPVQITPQVETQTSAVTTATPTEADEPTGMPTAPIDTPSDEQEIGEPPLMPMTPETTTATAVTPEPTPTAVTPEPTPTAAEEDNLGQEATEAEWGTTEIATESSSDNYVGTTEEGDCIPDFSGSDAFGGSYGNDTGATDEP